MAQEKQLISRIGTDQAAGYTLLEVLIVVVIIGVALLVALIPVRPTLDRSVVRSAEIELVSNWNRAVLISAETGILQQVSIDPSGTAYRFDPIGLIIDLEDGLLISETSSSINYARPTDQYGFIGVHQVDRSVSVNFNKDDAQQSVQFSWPTGSN